METMTMTSNSDESKKHPARGALAEQPYWRAARLKVTEAQMLEALGLRFSGARIDGARLDPDGAHGVELLISHPELPLVNHGKPFPLMPAEWLSEERTASAPDGDVQQITAILSHKGYSEADVEYMLAIADRLMRQAKFNERLSASLRVNRK